MNVPAEKIFGLMAIDKLAHRFRPGVLPFPNAVERRARGRGMADQHQRRELGEFVEPARQLSLAILTRRVERRRTGVAKPRDVPLAHLYRALMEIVQPVAFAQARDLPGR